MSKHHEDNAQAALFQWAALFPALKNMFAIPNGAYLAGDARKRAMQMARLKKQGLKPGVADIFLPFPTDQYHGLFIEMKRDKKHGKSSVSPDQKAFKLAMEAQGYKCVICYGTAEAIQAIQEYANI